MGPGVSCASNLRRRPKCFNLLYQLEFLVRSGMSDDGCIRQLEAWFLFWGIPILPLMSTYLLSSKSGKL